ncbi:MAG TPA: serine/threonine-protein kinase PknK, partial [Vicinamibacterales bacterium]|nr:serine/threonine-protein kinase PknK [Vicinamibacterales bacterium]
MGAPLDVEIVLRVGAGLAAALRHLHGRGLIHKDLKPANVMIDGATGRVWLRGFGISCPFPRERRPPEPPEFIAGTLAYMAPEQTGWMNRSIDARSDLYAYGVVLYEMLTGSLPFTASDPMAWVHCHIAKRPVPPAARRDDLPNVLSAIVMKLLAKTIEDRYQTAAGVEHDLRRCLTQWEAEGRIDEFSLAEHDTPDRLLIPEQLYGRTNEIQSLLRSFDHVVSSGTLELVLVSGYAGIGKSSVVNELYKALIPPRGFFASGKFDQYRRDIPYATLAQAFASLIRRLLGKSEADLAPWRDALLEALGLNGRLIVDLVPELTLIIGDQPAVPDLPPQDARRRFQLVLRKFIGVFAQADHPLALFLDDLQWLDAATLDLLEDLLIQGDVRHLLLVGAYRDNEVTSTHPLKRRLDVIRKAGVSVSEIALAPLTDKDVEQLAADALRREPAGTAALAHLVHAKTGGNPFFVIQFMSSLAEEGLLVFDHGAARWEWDLGRIEAKGHTDNVVDLMVARLTRLPEETQQALQPFACLGSHADARTLSTVLAMAEEQVHASLSPAVRQELVEHLADGYRFVHDRVQESAYTLIPPEQRASEHLMIGRLLALSTPSEAIPERVFEIVAQFNRAAPLVSSREEREQVAELNLIAGRRAKASTAYASALRYLAAGSSLLSASAWEGRYALAFALELQRAECEFLVGDVVAAEERLTSLAARAANLLDFAAITCLREELFTAVGRSDSAVEACLEFLRRIDVHWSPRPTGEAVQQEYERLLRHVGSREIETFVDLPPMTDAECRAAMDVLNAVLPAAQFSDPNLFSLVCCQMVNLTLTHGNCDASSVAFVYLGWLLGPRFGRYRAGFNFGKLGVELVERRGLRRFEARVYQIFGHLVVPWTQPVNVGSKLIERSFDAAIRAGDLAFATYSRPEIVFHWLAEGRSLADVQREAESGLDFARQVRFGLVIDIMTAQRQLILTLRGRTSAFGSFNDSEFDESRFEQHLANDPELSTAACQYWIHKLKARFLAGDYVAALSAASNAERFLWTQPTLFQPTDYRLYAALTLAALCEVASGSERTGHQNALAAHYRQFQEWAENCPANLEDAAALVGAEVARIDGRETDAMGLYQRAIAAARANGFVYNEALAYELAGRLYATRGFEEFAELYLSNARRAYLRWGADGKVRQLDALYAHLRNEHLVASDSKATIGAPVEQLELATVLKVSQAVSREIALDKLVETILQTAIEQAGAERGVLIEPRGDHLWILAEARTNDRSVTIVPRDVAVSGDELPESVVRYVARAHESVSLD